MNPSIYKSYKLEIEQISKNKSAIKKINDLKTNKNTLSAFANKKNVKLYIIKSKDKIVYVGITSQPILTRLRQGLNPYEKNGYHGYKWKHLKDVRLFLWCGFGKKEEVNKEMHDAETIEGEVVYSVRKLTDKWPEYQNEIHFHNGDQRQKEKALRIFLIAHRNKK